MRSLLWATRSDGRGAAGSCEAGSSCKGRRGNIVVAGMGCSRQQAVACGGMGPGSWGPIRVQAVAVPARGYSKAGQSSVPPASEGGVRMQHGQVRDMHSKAATRTTPFGR